MKIPAPLCPHVETLRVTLEAAGPDKPANQIHPAFRAIDDIAGLIQLKPAIGREMLHLQRDLLNLAVTLAHREDPEIFAAAREQALIRLRDVERGLRSAEPSDDAVRLGVAW